MTHYERTVETGHRRGSMKTDDKGVVVCSLLFMLVKKEKKNCFLNSALTKPNATEKAGIQNVS